MTEGVLALSMGTWQNIQSFFLAVHALVFVLLIICLFLASRYFLHANREQKLIRMDVGKLAEEVHLLRREVKQNKDSDSAVQ